MALPARKGDGYLAYNLTLPGRKALNLLFSRPKAELDVSLFWGQFFFFKGGREASNILTWGKTLLHVFVRFVFSMLVI